MASPADEVAEILRLDNSWTEAYRRHDRAPVAALLADDCSALAPSGEPITKAALMVDPPGRARSVVFSEASAQVFGDTAVSRGRLQLEFDDRRVDAIPLRVFAKRRRLAGGVSGGHAGRPDGDLSRARRAANASKQPRRPLPLIWAVCAQKPRIAAEIQPSEDCGAPTHAQKCSEVFT